MYHDRISHSQPSEKLPINPECFYFITAAALWVCCGPDNLTILYHTIITWPINYVQTYINIITKNIRESEKLKVANRCMVRMIDLLTLTHMGTCFLPRAFPTQLVSK